MGPSSFSLLATLLFTASLPGPTVPNHANLRIKTRKTDAFGVGTTTLYLKGARQRQEIIQDAPIKYSFIDIWQCDQKRNIHLNRDAKLYAESPIVDFAQLHKRAVAVNAAPANGPDVQITVDSVDTGERRPVGRFTARHVKMTRRTEAAPGATMHSMVEERDGWYVDLPSVGCQALANRGSVTFSFSALRPAGRRDQIHFKRLGTAALGFPIEETTTRIEDGRTNVSKTELLEFDESPLDAALFEKPPDYSSARRTPHGGYDMTQPDTLTNRVQVYWSELTGSIRGLFDRER
jgi:hypothetical protein